MKGIITGIKRLAVHDGDGLRTTVFFKGCPLRCVWCHNPETYSYKKEIAFYSAKCIGCNSCVDECAYGALTKDFYDETRCVHCLKCTEVCPTDARSLLGVEYEASDLAEKILEDEQFFKNGNGGVTLSGGECLSQPNFATELAKIFYDKKISVDIDTCGFVSQESLEKIIPYTDVFLYDIKAIDGDVHRKCTGQDNKIILDNLRFLTERGCKIEIRYPLIMGYNDGECEGIGRFLKNLGGITKIKVLKYHSFARSKFDAIGLSDTMPNIETTYTDVENAVKTLRSFGLNAINGIDDD